jgi:hypothetical protein
LEWEDITYTAHDLALRTHENIAASRFDGSGDEFNGEDDAFD